MNIKWIGVPMVANIKDGSEMGPISVGNVEIGVDIDSGNVVFRAIEPKDPIDTSHSVDTQGR